MGSGAMSAPPPHLVVEGPEPVEVPRPRDGLSERWSWARTPERRQRLHAAKPLCEVAALGADAFKANGNCHVYAMADLSIAG